MIPPAYPAPSPHGYMPFIFPFNSLSLVILSGDEVLLSTPSKSAPSSSKPLIDLPNTGIHSFKASHKLSGNTVFISANSTFPFVTGVTVENSVDLIPFLK